MELLTGLLIKAIGQGVATQDTQTGCQVSDQLKVYLATGVENAKNILDDVAPCITHEMNDELFRVFSYEEVCLALKNMALLMASGEDGLGAVFYQIFWHIVWKEVADYCIDILNGT
ncbi:hypothetical protein PVK06_048824 [Gossypium arboreum]|uniref:Uncharacterized protein n=1 Tax=Gossypium arboreum TaxID=29729 RepID=A0ABR0MJ15_GOSAR|nr:hypothetical protein PVK06_048824 [Gossypium arboreum]